MATALATDYVRGRELVRGKTKALHEWKGRKTLAIFEYLNEITGGDGARRDDALGKAVLCNQINTNVMGLLRACGIPTTFVEQISDTEYVGKLGDMLLWEVVARREGRGANNKQRFPHIPEGQLFAKLQVEFFLKTKDKVWKDHELPCDDPYTIHDKENGVYKLYDAHKPVHGSEPFLVLPESEVFTQPHERELLLCMEDITRRVFLILEKAWQILGGTLYDFKLEFCIGPDWRLCLSDVIDPDSWRLNVDGEFLDKDLYRLTGNVVETLRKYAVAAELSRRFTIPHQRIVIWSGSPRDKLEPFYNALVDFNWNPEMVEVKEIACSAHKEPVKAMAMLQTLAHEPVDTIILAYAGMANALGPMLAAGSTLQVIAIAKDGSTHAEDLLSLMRSPSRVPVLVSPDPANAIHAALNRFSAHNPWLYSILQGKVEEKRVNTVKI